MRYKEQLFHRKKIRSLTAFTLVSVALFSLLSDAACAKDRSVEASSPATQQEEPKAGTKKTVVLTSGSQMHDAAPPLMKVIEADRSQAQTLRPLFRLAKIDAPIIKEFRKAWHISGDGTTDVEGVVLIFSNADGSYRGLTLKSTNESRQVTFRWNPGIIAIVHTHPTRAFPQPCGKDIPLADRFGVPVFTITVKGMFMYDPTTKRISKIRDGLDWLELSHWTQRQYIAAK